MGFVTGILEFVGGIFKGVFGWFGRNPAAGFVLIFAAAFLLVIHAKNEQIKGVEAYSKQKDERIIAISTSLSQARANIATLTAGIQDQNASIQRLSDLSAGSTARFDDAMRILNAANNNDQKQLAALASAKPGADKCLSAFQLTKGAAK